MSTRAVRRGARPHARACLLVPVVLLSVARSSGDVFANEIGKGTPKSQAIHRAAGTPPGEESLSDRRAVRGVPVDEGAESPELCELKRFEEEAFPRAGAKPSGRVDGDAAMEPPPSLPGRWEGTGDVPEALRSPETTLTAPRPLPTPDSDWLRSLKLPELPVRWDPQVLRYLDYFKNDPRGRSVMSNWLRRAGRFRSIIDVALEREGLPKDLIYVAMVESGFESSARSPVGAGGVWQFMPSAARAYGLEVGYWVDARRDPERSVEAAARYLKDLYVRFGSWHLVFAAYNAGYGAVLKSITRYNTNDYWELCRHEAGLPWESSLYVPKILAAAIVGHNLEAFGYADIVPDPPFTYEKVDVPAGTGLATVARATKARPEVIAALNPQIVRDRTPPDRGGTTLRIPVGTTALFAEAFERSRAASENLETVTLRFGETLDDVAKARGTSVRELRRLNGVKDSTELRGGLAIVVPVSRLKPKAAGAAVTADAAKTAGTPDDDDILVAVPDRVFNYEGRERVFYRTRDGDTVDEIAETFGVRPDDVIDWNSLDSTAKLHPKMVLQIFVRKDFDPTQVVLLDPERVRVVTLGSDEFLELEAARRGKKRLVIETKAGDTLIRLGRRYGLTIGDLARINRFSYNTELHDGQKVVVYSPFGTGPRELTSGLSPEPRHDRAVIALARGGAAKSSDKSVGRSGERATAREKTGQAIREKTVAAGGIKATVARGVGAGGKSAPKVQARPESQKPASKKK